MQFTVTINQAKALEWGLNSQQALLFAFVYGCPSWANPVKTDDGIFFALSKAKITEELPLLTDKPDTAYRMLKALEEAGLIELSSTSNITLFRLTAKATEWNRKQDGSEKYPTSEQANGRKKIRTWSEKNPSKVGKKSELGSEKNPTNQDTSNQDTNQDTNQNLLPTTLAPSSRGAKSAASDAEAGRQEACRSIWSAYSAAYEARYQTLPIRNAKVNRNVNDLLKRLGGEAAPVAAFYVGIEDSYLIRTCHDFGNLLSKAEAYRTQWATNLQMTGSKARQMEKTKANVSALEQALAEQRARRESNA